MKDNFDVNIQNPKIAVMDNSHNVIESIIRSGVVHCKETDWSDAAPMVERLLAQVKQRVVLFLGAAISSLKPAKLPMWDKFIELLWSSMIENAVAHHTEKEGNQLVMSSTISSELTLAEISVPNSQHFSRALLSLMIRTRFPITCSQKSSHGG